MTDSTTRQPKGVPTGGQFAATTHAEPTLNLAPRRSELDGWPESLPEPVVTVHLGDDNVITTTVSINGEPAFEVWNPGDDVHSTESTGFGGDETQDQEVADAAEKWATDKHEQIAATLRAEMHTAVERSRARAIATATGASPAISDEDLGSLLAANNAAAYAGHRDGELAATALIARGVLKEQPDAHHIGLQIDSADNGEYVSGAIAYHADGTVLAHYDADGHHLNDEGEDVPGADFVELLSNLSPHPDTAWWNSYNEPIVEDDDMYTINLNQAAAWTPGGES